MKIQQSTFRLLLFSAAGSLTLSACSSRDEVAQAKEFRAKAEQIRKESDPIAAEIAAVQQDIRDLDSGDINGPDAAAARSVKEKEVQVEKDRLQKLVQGLKAANSQLAKEQAEFSQKYLKP